MDLIPRSGLIEWNGMKLNWVWFGLVWFAWLWPGLIRFDVM
jgi:hypothetical protein